MGIFGEWGNAVRGMRNLSGDLRGALSGSPFHVVRTELDTLFRVTRHAHLIPMELTDYSPV